jgi:SAM-dependent methyltransferase
LLQQGRDWFGKAGLNATLARGDVTAAPVADGGFDLAFAHAVLMHQPDPAVALGEMIRVTRPGGLVIACDSNQTAVNALLHVHETEEQERTPLALWQKTKAYWRRTHGPDANQGLKTPVLMRQAGLTDIGARISDAVSLSFPPIDTSEKERVLAAILDDGLGGYPIDEASFQGAVGRLVRNGAEEAEAARGAAQRDGQRLSSHRPQLPHRPAGGDGDQLRAGPDATCGGAIAPGAALWNGQGRRRKKARVARRGGGELEVDCAR